MRPSVYITRKIPNEIVEKLEKECVVSMWEKEDQPVPREVLVKETERVDAVFCLLTEQIDKEIIERAKNLKVIGNMAVGYNNVDVEAAKEKGIIVTNTPGVLTETTADLTFALLMATARRIVEASNYLHNGSWKTWSPMELTGQDVFGATMGIIGMGRIGQALAKRAKGFDMNVIYYNRSRKIEVEETCNAIYMELEDLISESDFICILLPYSPAVKDLIGEKELSLMKKNAIIINTARGGILNEQALYEALKSNQIAGAGLDVFEVEPVPTDHPLLQLPNVVAIPHIGSASRATRMKMAHLAADNIIQVLKGKNPITPVSL